MASALLSPTWRLRAGCCWRCWCSSATEVRCSLCPPDALAHFARRFTFPPFALQLAAAACASAPFVGAAPPACAGMLARVQVSVRKSVIRGLCGDEELMRRDCGSEMGPAPWARANAQLSRAKRCVGTACGTASGTATAPISRSEPEQSETSGPVRDRSGTSPGPVRA